MMNNTTKPDSLQPAAEKAVDLFDNWFDPIETEVRVRAREFIEELLRGELDTARPRPRYGRSQMAGNEARALGAAPGSPDAAHGRPDQFGPGWIGKSTRFVRLRNRGDMPDEARHDQRIGAGGQISSDRFGGRRDRAALAFRLASAFLLPSTTYPHEVRRPSLTALLSLKERWRVSVKAQIKRLSDLDIIPETHATDLYKLYSAKGWNREEPMDREWLVPEPRSLADAMNIVVDSGLHTKADLKARTPVDKIIKLTKRTEGSLRQKALKLGIGLGHQR